MIIYLYIFFKEGEELKLIIKIKDIFYEIKLKLKDFIHNSIENMIQKFNRYNLKHMQDFIRKENKYKYEDLMPKIDTDRNKQYCETLEWALKNYNIKNIALTGVYGSGKSTILKTFETLHKEYKYLNISMATFNDGLEKKKAAENKEQIVESGGDEAKKISSVTSTIDNAVIEKGILQQMFYKVKYKSIPGSRFKRIRNYKFLHILYKTIIILAAISFGVILYKPEIFSKLYENVLYIQNTFKINSIVTYSCGLLLLILLLIILTPAIRYLSNGFRITKISTKAGDAQLDDSEKSIFNKYIDEILYFFEMSKYDVVVFEDLDRFNNIEIFSKLRELNLLINNSEQINRRVAFIYAIKDDMFSNDENKDDKFHYKNRTKFFDFIIPVVQVANSSNACNLMIEKFKEAGMLDELGEEFISDIAFLINDRRVLNNIFNEYIIYKENLKHIDKKNINDEDNNQYENKLDPTKLLAIIVYKNMYPADFAKLQDDEGMVYEIFKNKDKLIESKIKQLEEESKKIELKIKYDEKECMEKVSELRILYANYILNGQSYVNINQRSFDLKNLSSESGINTFLNTQMNDVRYNKLKEEYLKRLEVVKLREFNVKPNVLEYLKKELENTYKEINLLSSKPLKDSINNGNINEIFKDDISNADLLKFLIKEGHIDENYSEYISYFYGGVITPRDNEFIHNVMFEKEMEFARTLDKPKNVMKKIREYRFTQKYTLNYSLLDFIIENKEDNKKYEACYKLIIEQLSNEIDSSLLFIDGYIERRNHIDVFIKSLCNNWSEMWDYVQNRSNFTQERKNIYLKYILEFADNDDIEKMNGRYITEYTSEETLDLLDKEADINEEIPPILTQYISKSSVFLEIIVDEDKFSKIKELLKKLNIKFECLNKNRYENNEIFEFIIENDIYLINSHMIELIVENKSNKTAEELSTSNYTAILESSCGELIEYVNKNINSYIENVFLKLDGNINESEETMIYLLKVDGISKDILLENKEAMIKKENTVFSDIESVEFISGWPTLIKDEKIKITWNNVITFYKQLIIEKDILLNYLNKEKVYKELSRNDINDEISKFGKDYLEGFAREIILNDKLTEACFKELVKSITYRNIEIDLDNIKLERIDIIIQDKIIGLTKKNYDKLKERFANENKHILLIEKNLDEYVKNYTEYDLDSTDILKLLDAPIENDKKLFVINNMNMQLVDESTILTYKIVDFMLNNDILSKLETILLSKIISNNNVTEKEKILILINQIEFMDKDKTFQFLNLISDVYSNLSEMDNEITIENNYYNEKLAKVLKSKGYVNEFKPYNEEAIIMTTKTA